MNVKARLYAFLAHLALSGLVAALSMAMVFVVWYPMPLDDATGVTDIYLILLAVDIILGPMMTFVVFKPKKPGLKMDLTIIGVLQLTALAYGMLTVFEGRPVFVIFNQDRFDLVRPVDIDSASAKKALQAGNQLAQLSWFGPKWLGAEAPADSKRNQEIMFSAATGGADWPQLPELYVPLEQVKPKMLKKALPFDMLHALIKRQGGSEDLLKGIDGRQVKWLPLRGKVKDMVVLINSKTADVIKIVDISPWSQ